MYMQDRPSSVRGSGLPDVATLLTSHGDAAFGWAAAHTALALTVHRNAVGICSGDAGGL